MGAIQDAIEAIESREPGEDFTYRNIAKIFGVNRTTLARRHKGSQASQTVILTNQQKLSPEEELELVDYINRLTKRALLPTQEIIQNFASQVAGEPIGKAQVTYFINCQSDHLTS